MSEYIDKIKQAENEREIAFEHVRQAKSLVDSGDFVRARAHLVSAKDSAFITKAERGQISAELEALDGRISLREKAIRHVYRRSVDDYEAGRLESARDGFVKVTSSGVLKLPAGERAEDYLLKIDSVLVGKAERAIRSEVKARDEGADGILGIEESLLGVEARKRQRSRSVKQVEDKALMAEVKAVEKKRVLLNERKETEVVDRQSKIVRSYIAAVVRQAIAEAIGYMAENRYAEAKDELVKAQLQVNRKRKELGEALYQRYSEQLNKVSARLDKGR